MTRLPQLEQELIAAATRLPRPRRLIGPALAVGTMLAVVLAVLLAAGEDADHSAERSASLPFPPGAQLEDMLAIFRRPATEADDAGIRQINDRLPGEDPSRSRRVRSPDAKIFMWPMREGVCYDVGRGGGCVRLEHLRRQGVTVGTHSSGGRRSFYGIVVDGVREVVLIAPGGRERRVAVTDNFFFVNLRSGTPVVEVSWRYAGRTRSYDASAILDVLAPPAPPGAPEGAPDPRVEPRVESASRPLEFAVAGTRYRAVGFHTQRTAVCVALTDLDAGRLSGSSCLSERILRDALQSRPAHQFAGGGHPVLVHTGFARADVIEIAPVERPGEVTVILSEPWRPRPWRGEPIRFFFAFDRAPGAIKPGGPPRAELEARLKDGRAVRVP
jgi:hypothetical protein